MMHLQIIVFIWSQYDDGNIEQRTIGYGYSQNQEAKLEIVGGVTPLIQPKKKLIQPEGYMTNWCISSLKYYFVMLWGLMNTLNLKFFNRN